MDADTYPECDPHGVTHGDCDGYAVTYRDQYADGDAHTNVGFSPSLSAACHEVMNWLVGRWNNDRAYTVRLCKVESVCTRNGCVVYWP